MYEFKDVKYKDILDIKDLTIKDKTTCFITGPLGSGKSTLLKLLNKMISKDEGSILYRGEDIEKIDSIRLRRRVLMLNQSPQIYEGNIRDNLLIGREFAEEDKLTDDILREALTSVFLDKNLDDEPYKLSGGEKQRLALARILLMDFDLLILDEPSSALDKNNEKEIIGSIVDFVKENEKSLIVVSHSRDLIDYFAQEVIYIKDGKVDRRESFE